MKDSPNFDQIYVGYYKTLIQNIEDLDTLLSYEKMFTLGFYLEQLDELEKESGTANTLIVDFKNQITLWGWKGEIND